MKKMHLDGSRFGHLTVIEAALSKKSGATSVTMWRVRCDCGMETVVRTNNLVRGRTKSCGRLRCPAGGRENLRGDYPAGGVRQVWNLYRLRALRKGIEFELTAHDVEQVILRPCFYCGVQPSNVARSESPRSRIRFSGMDRVDNAAGYVKSNVVPCCKVCNVMKHQLSVGEFTQHILLLAERSSGWANPQGNAPCVLREMRKGSEMSRRGLEVGDAVRVGLHGDRRWTGTVVSMQRGVKRGDWSFLIKRDVPGDRDPVVWVMDKYVRPKPSE